MALRSQRASLATRLGEVMRGKVVYSATRWIPMVNKFLKKMFRQGLIYIPDYQGILILCSTSFKLGIKEMEVASDVTQVMRQYYKPA